MNNTITDEASVQMLQNYLNNISGIAVEEIQNILNMIDETLINKEVSRFIGRVFRQWINGESLTNPIVIFTKELKAGMYDALDVDEIDLMHEAAVALSGLWRSEPEVSAEKMKNNIGYFLMQRIILRVTGILQEGDSDAKPA